MMSIQNAVLCATAALALAACAARTPAAVPELADARAAVSAADAVGAQEHPEARLHMKLAKEQLEQAEGLLGEDAQRAARLLQRAEADARLALALARAADLRQEAEESVSRIRELRQRTQ